MPENIMRRVVVSMADSAPLTTNNVQAAIGRGTEVPVTANSQRFTIEITSAPLTVATIRLEAFFSTTNAWTFVPIRDVVNASNALVDTVTALAGGTLRYEYDPPPGVTKIAANITSRTAGSVTIRITERKLTTR